MAVAASGGDRCCYPGLILVTENIVSCHHRAEKRCHTEEACNRKPLNLETIIEGVRLFKAGSSCREGYLGC